MEIIIAYCFRIAIVLLARSILDEDQHFLSMSPSYTMNIYSFNATSLKNKLDDFNGHFSTNDYDVICISETWLNGNIFDGEILTDLDYDLYRKDRDLKRIAKANGEFKEDGGGVFCAVKSSLVSKRRYDLEDNLELIWIEIIQSKQRSIYVGVIYLPDWCKAHDIDSLCTSLDKLRRITRDTDSIFLTGDFNFHIKWKCDTASNSTFVLNEAELLPLCAQFMEVLSLHDLKQWNTSPTHGENVLDLVITNNDDNVHVNIVNADKAVSSTHLPLDVTVNFTIPKRRKASNRTVHNYRKANFKDIIQLLFCINWSVINDFPSIDEACDYFYDMIFAVIKDNIPTICIKNRSYPQWYDRKLKLLCQDKDHLRHVYNQARMYNPDSLSEYQKYSEARADFKKYKKKRYHEYVKEISGEMMENPKRFWSYVKTQRAVKGIPQIMTSNGRSFRTPNTIAEAFITFFESMFLTNPHPPIPTFDSLPFSQSVFIMPRVTPDDIKRELLLLNDSVSMGSDKVSALFLKNCAEAICIPIAQLFNKSVSLGEYPTIFKYNLVLPVHKKDDRSNIANYRPISIEPILAKIFERFVNNSLRQQLTNYMCFEQHGFLPGRSTISNLACYADEVSRCLDEKTEMHSIYTDFSRAFDSVCHDFLIAKLEYHYGIHGVSLKWFRSYLSGRYQRVVVHGVESTWTKVTSGVVQGSVLGPTMFNLFINDLPLAIKSSRCSLFADDAKMFKQIKRLLDCYELQSDIDNLKLWCEKWYITINLTKCKYISFSLLKSRSIEYTYHFGAHIIEQVNEIKDLGVIFSKNLNFSTHINYIVKKVLECLVLLNDQQNLLIMLKF